jgi:hypothetical protein
MRQVTARIYQDKKWVQIGGVFHQWGHAYEEYHAGPGNYTIAVIELPDGKVVTALPEDVRFCDKEVV